MTDPLPRPDFVPLPPPPGGLASAVHRGRRLRRRRRVATTGAVTAGIAAVVVVLALNGSGATGAQDELVPAGPGPATAVPRSPQPAHDSRPAPAQRVADPAASGAPRPVAAAPVAAGRRPSPAAARTATPATRGGYRTPELLRSYRTAPTTGTSPSHGPNPSVCSTAVSSGSGGVDASSNWCVTARVTTTSRGHDLSIDVCRDSTAPAQLHFGRRLEVDLVVLAGNRTVWRWSAGHEDAAQGHTLDAAADACWTWTAPWTDVDATGRALPAGDYTLSVTSKATELRAYDPRLAPFSIG